MRSPFRLREHDDEAAAGDTPSRWRLKPASSSPAGCVDGGWWPGTDDLAAELPALLAAVSTESDPIERVTYPIDDWAPAARKTTIDGAVVRLGGFHSQEAGTVDLLSRTRRITLLVVPPATDPAAAERALAAAGDSENVDDVATLLAIAHPAQEPANS